jgi:hypothetical protein
MKDQAKPVFGIVANEGAVVLYTRDRKIKKLINNINRN